MVVHMHAYPLTCSAARGQEQVGCWLRVIQQDMRA